MAHFLRAKQAGIQKDLSGGIVADDFNIEEFARYGINSQISTLAYDPVQSLLAVGTKESAYGNGQIYVFGRKRVSATFTLPRKASVRVVRFCADKLMVIDSKNEMILYSLETQTSLANYIPPSPVTAVTTDPSLDWAFLGMQNG
ncbi:MAG: Lethal(2) giant larvae protein 1 [Peltula sp. TS41687]|nr:MAG: Lethal(2) giant larvae protein 1 [Peltula sp. TS41687]